MLCSTPIYGHCLTLEQHQAIPTAALSAVPQICDDDGDTASAIKVKNVADDMQRMTFDLSPEECQSHLMAYKLHAIRPTCALAFKYNHLCQTNSKKSAAAFWTAKAKCRVGKCVSVVLVIDSQPEPNTTVPVNVYVRGECTHTMASGQREFTVEMANKRFFSGKRRIELVEECIQNISAVIRCREAKAAMTDEELSAGKIVICQTAHVISQSIYERKKKQQLHKDVLIKLATKQNTWEASLGTKITGFIQGLGMQPFYCLFYIQEQAELYIRQCRSSDKVFLYFDSTGSIVKDLSSGDADIKKPCTYYY